MPGVNGGKHLRQDLTPWLFEFGALVGGIREAVGG